MIASAKRILDLQLPRSVVPPIQIAILSHDARTLRSSLRRTGTTLMVRRPVHPAALRALVLHSLYRGPEKRRSARVNVGAPVRLKLGWRHRNAILDRSLGERLPADDAIARSSAASRSGSRFPAEVAGGRALAVEARVRPVRAESPIRALGRFVTSASFDPVDARLHAQLQAAVAAHAEGPAVCEGAPRIAARRDAAAPARRAGRGGARRATGRALELASRRHRDRRRRPLDEEAARVLMGRDLSRGGMRVTRIRCSRSA